MYTRTARRNGFDSRTHDRRAISPPRIRDMLACGFVPAPTPAASPRPGGEPACLRSQRRRGAGRPLFSQRNVRALARLVLAWFVLSLGVAVAAPCVQPMSMQLVCSSAGAVKVIVNVDGTVHDMGAGQMDCPLCAPGGAPPVMPAMLDIAPGVQPLGRVVQSIPAARLAAMVAAPLPPRGPPPLV